VKEGAIVNTNHLHVPAPGLRTVARVAQLAALSAVLMLSACGGDPAAADPDAIPSAPAATSMEFSQFVSKRMADDVAEPLDVEAVTPPTSESEEPIDVA
jgi:hypothetical protein